MPMVMVGKINVGMRQFVAKINSKTDGDHISYPTEVISTNAQRKRRLC
jgi:hypothetical protein